MKHKANPNWERSKLTGAIRKGFLEVVALQLFWKPAQAHNAQLHVDSLPVGNKESVGYWQEQGLGVLHRGSGLFSASNLLRSWAMYYQSCGHLAPSSAKKSRPDST